MAISCYTGFFNLFLFFATNKYFKTWHTRFFLLETTSCSILLQYNLTLRLCIAIPIQVTYIFLWIWFPFNMDCWTYSHSGLKWEETPKPKYGFFCDYSYSVIHNNRVIVISSKETWYFSISVFTTMLSLRYLLRKDFSLCHQKNQYAHTICKPSLRDENSLSRSNFYANQKQIKKESVY